jgi:hypothetical protein
MKKRINSLDEFRKWLHEEWALDQSDSSDITNAAATLMETVKTIDTISKYNRERIEEWKRVTKIKDKKASDMAQDIMESLFYRTLEISPLEKGRKI